mmetsp:Transcript_13018/g.15877  ORF Transcript_13018/g.15877 Transcript_13018/m.15877 type:complete len:167 (-) Transcript_13018:697-1197(-)
MEKDNETEKASFLCLGFVPDTSTECSGGLKSLSECVQGFGSSLAEFGNSISIPTHKIRIVSQYVRIQKIPEPSTYYLERIFDQTPKLNKRFSKPKFKPNKQFSKPNKNGVDSYGRNIPQNDHVGGAMLHVAIWYLMNAMANVCFFSVLNNTLPHNVRSFLFYETRQ